MNLRAAKLVQLTKYMNLETGLIHSRISIAQAKKKVKLLILNRQIRKCDQCNTQGFRETFEVSSPTDAKLVIVKSSFQENNTMLLLALKLSNLSENQVFFTHAAHCGLPQGQHITTEMKNNCGKFLQRELNLVQPIMVAALGSDAADVVAGIEVSQGIKVLKVRSPFVYEYSSPESRVNWVVKLSLAIDKVLKDNLA